MKSRIFSLLVIAALTATAVGCKKKPTGVTHIPNGRGPAITGPKAMPFDDGNRINPGEGIIPTDVSEPPTGIGAATGPMNTGPQDRTILQAETIYFDLDSSTVKTSEREKLQRVADYLKSNPANDLMIEGHCDERGTEGYNQSLGEKRALATREALAEMGAPAGSIYTTSYGETRPAAEGAGEGAWAKNRRSEFVVALPAQ